MVRPPRLKPPPLGSTSSGRWIVLASKPVAFAIARKRDELGPTTAEEIAGGDQQGVTFTSVQTALAK
jgi:hypothetical protein